MATKRKDELNRLRIASPCQSSWDAMIEDKRYDGREGGPRRHCLECDKHVYDFAQLTPREAAGVVEATRGQLCARLTRDGYGRLVTLEPPALPAGALVARRASPFAAAAVTAFLGLGGSAWADPPAAPSPSAAAEQGAGKEPEGARPQRAGDAGGALAGRLTTEAGEAVADAEVQAYNQLGGERRIGRTDADGRFVFPALTPGVYGLNATVRGHDAASQWDVLLAAGERRQVGLTVPAEVWQGIVSGEIQEPTLGVMVMSEPPLRQVFEEAEVVVLAVAGKSVAVEQGSYTTEVRTELAISAVLKGETREKVISLFHDQDPEEDAASRLKPGDEVLAFLEPRDAEEGGGGYVAADSMLGWRALADTEADAYRQRVGALARVPRDGAARPAALLEWLVATVEEPATRKEAVRELGHAVWSLEQKAGERGTPVDAYAEDLKGVFADFLAAGGSAGDEPDPALLAAYLTGDQRERLSKALLRTPRLESADLDLYGIVSPWHADRLLPWLTRQLAAGEADVPTGRLMMATLAEALDDEGLAELQAAGEERLAELERELYDAESDAARQRLGEKLAAAGEEVRRKFVAALRQRGR